MPPSPHFTGHRDRAATSLALAGVVALGAAGFGAGCKDVKDRHDGSARTTVDASQRTLYERLGGEPAVTAVVHDFVGRAATDPKVNFTRKGQPTQWEATPANVAKLERRLVQFVAMATGGPQTYEGRDMVAVHTGMNITEGEWAAAVADLEASLDKLKVAPAEHAELVKVVGSTHDQIVGK